MRGMATPRWSTHAKTLVRRCHLGRSCMHVLACRLLCCVGEVSPALLGDMHCAICSTKTCEALLGFTCEGREVAVPGQSLCIDSHQISPQQNVVGQRSAKQLLQLECIGLAHVHTTGVWAALNVTTRCCVGRSVCLQHPSASPLCSLRA